jgi:hypothetical protein
LSLYTGKYLESFELAAQKVRTGLPFRCINLRSPLAACND